MSDSPTRLPRPQLTVDLDKVRSNVGGMVEKFERHGVRFRPHFKTHQCAAIGEIYRDHGVTQITVSSLDMARYFHEHGWADITLAVPVNLGQLDEIAELAPRLRLNLLVDSLETATELSDALAQMEKPCPVWVKVDVGYGRVGIKWDKPDEILALVEFLMSAPRLDFVGLLTHSGHSYECRGREQVVACFEEGRNRMLKLKEVLSERGIEAEISMGDTPSASLAENFEGVGEMRPGNFVFYDLFQSQVGSCTADQIAVATACPVIGKYPDELKVVVYGGSVHLSKDSVMIEGERLFGQLALPIADGRAGWDIVPLEAAKITSACQEVSKIEVSKDVFERIALGQTVYILPAHSCLAAEVYPRYVSTDGQMLERFRLFV